MANGRTAIAALKTYKTAVEEKNEPLAQEALTTLKKIMPISVTAT